MTNSRLKGLGRAMAAAAAVVLAAPSLEAYPDAKVPLTFFDGSCRVIQTDETNPAWWPNFPTVSAAYTMAYQPDVWEPPVRGGPTQFPPPLGSETVGTWYRWTRGGLKGVDVGGDPIDTGQN